METLPPVEEFLTDWDVEQLTALTVFEDDFPNSADYRDVDFPSRFKYPYTGPASVVAIAPENILEIHGGVLQQIYDDQVVTASAAVPWCPRGEGAVPIIQNQGTILLKKQVPQGYVWFIDGYALGLFPSTANELNYYWQIRVDGEDILNKGNFDPQPGRPVLNNGKVTIGRNKGDMYLCQPGSVVEVVAVALNTLGASDNMSACVFGQLQGMGQ